VCKSEPDGAPTIRQDIPEVSHHKGRYGRHCLQIIPLGSRLQVEGHRHGAGYGALLHEKQEEHEAMSEGMRLSEKSLFEYLKLN